MSAYIVSKNHIVYMVTAAKVLGHTNGCMRRDLGSKPLHKQATALWQENVKSVNARYDRVDGQEPVEEFVIKPEDIPQYVVAPDPVQLVKSIICYEYQACEHRNWPRSRAKKWCYDVKESILRALPGYSTAIWGCPEDERSNIGCKARFQSYLIPIILRCLEKIPLLTWNVINIFDHLINFARCQSPGTFKNRDVISGMEIWLREGNLRDLASTHGSIIAIYESCNGRKLPDDEIDKLVNNDWWREIASLIVILSRNGTQVIRTK